LLPRRRIPKRRAARRAPLFEALLQWCVAWRRRKTILRLRSNLRFAP
jgi:hypothetical protein